MKKYKFTSPCGGNISITAESKAEATSHLQDWLDDESDSSDPEDFACVIVDEDGNEAEVVICPQCNAEIDMSEDGTHCDICDETVCNDHIEWDACQRDEYTWENICKNCFAKYEAKLKKRK